MTTHTQTTREAVALVPPTTTTPWTTEEIAVRKAAWVATAARLAATMPLETAEDRTAYLAAVEAEVGYTLVELQHAISGLAGPAPACVRAAPKTMREMVTYGNWNGGGGVRGVACDGASLVTQLAA